MKRTALPVTVLALVLGLSLFVPVVRAGLIIGEPPDPVFANCDPFGCAYSGEYQQVYTSSQFSGPITITNIEFFNTRDNARASSMNSGSWAISLSTTSADWNTLSSTFSLNTGSNNTLVFDGSLAQPWTFGDTLTIGLSKPFTYNPSSGNLLMDVVATDVSGGVGQPVSIYFDANGYNDANYNGNTIMGRVYLIGGVATVNSGYGLVTGFNAAVPIPGAILLFAPGLVGLAAMRRRFKR